MSDATPELLTRNLHLNKMPSPADACAYWHLQSTGFLSYILAHNIYLYVIDGKRKPQNKWELPLEAPGPELETKASPPEHFSPPPSLAVFFSGGSLRCSLRPWANPGPRSCSIFSSSVEHRAVCGGESPGRPHWYQLRPGAASVKEVLSKAHFKCLFISTS